MTDTGPAGSFLTLPYTYNADGQVATDNTTGTPAGPSEQYSYNANSQLTGVQDPLATGPVTTHAYSYDTAGDLTGIAGATPGLTLAYNSAQELTTATDALNQATSYSFNFGGDRTSQSNRGGSTYYTWNQANQLVGYAGPPLTTLNGQAGTDAYLSYSYNGDGLLSSTPTGDHPAYNEAGPMPIMISDGSASYITGPNGLPVEAITPGGVSLYYHADRLGSTWALTNSAGTVVQSYTYSPYGTATTDNATVVNPFLYAGQYTDTASGLIWMRARWYDPTTGQFLSVDPLVKLTNSPYSYAGDNPVNEVDLTGLCALSAAEAIGKSALVFASFASGLAFGYGLVGFLQPFLAPALFATIATYTSAAFAIAFAYAAGATNSEPGPPQG